MALVTIKEDTLTAIANTIRSKTGKTETMSATQMPSEILSIVAEGNEGYALPTSIECDLNTTITGGSLDWLFEAVPTLTITHKYTNGYLYDLNLNLLDFFANSQVKDLSHITVIHDPDVMKGSRPRQGAFFNCQRLEALPKIYADSFPMKAIFYNCHRLREIPSDFFYVRDENGVVGNQMSASTNYYKAFHCCYSLRKLPPFRTKSYPINFQYAFAHCWNLDEIKDVPVYSNTLSVDYNVYSNAFINCCRAKDVTFATREDGTPYTVQWSEVTIDLSEYVGHYDTSYPRFQYYNSGIAVNKHVYSAELYNQLKDDPDWYTEYASMSRYDRDSAINTINSLPDASEYLTNTGKTANTLKLRAECGNGRANAIGLLTEEEIAVAAAKGWTVSLV